MSTELIHDRIPLQVLSPEVFDRFMEKGWRILGYVILRHSALMYKDEITFTVPLRIRLEGFEFSKSQRKMLRRHRERFRYQLRSIQITPEKNALFLKHCERFEFGNHYTDLSTFITNESWYLPVKGYEIEVYDGEKLVACSYFHLGEVSFCATYCYFDPDYKNDSLGNFTMLLEIEMAMQTGKKYYYSGYAHDTPSQFDYKYNFNNLEAYSWDDELWSPIERKPPAPRTQYPDRDL
jgi:arginine-tRNA-protein transferase